MQDNYKISLDGFAEQLAANWNSLRLDRGNDAADESLRDSLHRLRIRGVIDDSDHDRLIKELAILISAYLVDERVTSTNNRVRQAREVPDKPTVPFHAPPRCAEKALHLLLPRHQREYLIGDLEEEFRTIIIPKYGTGFARVWYWKQALSSVSSVVACRITKLAALAWFGKAAAWLWNKLGS